ncbi:peptide ABC transporter substrate-binding protein [Treponema brennaborense]|uniref:ABC-type transporter, periplasmic subunit n=1 Tax=Treponema brennaborense (strain DSM 12168 / CIP 105900 / DD5/3) TaxID=906968 RepID=F4LJB7_TREBD|nr:peptide ABC transporter substrate-binding protein [Treponema brennaborense]AEE17362.1 ABC-type transporter, periplasmic subunit [Treponema brennaborense DSM 12168]
MSINFTRKIIPLICAVTLCAAAAVAAEQESSESTESERNSITVIDLKHEYDLNPHTANYSSEAQILTGLYEGLFSYDPYTLEPVPALAESYKLSRNKLRWTFTLRENAAFSDGTPITAQTVKDSWITLLAPETHAPFASLLDCIEGAYEYRTGAAAAGSVAITVHDERTLSVALTAPAEHLNRILCHHAFAAVSPEPGIYSGAFVLDSYADDTLELVKNPQYWDAENVKLDAITVRQSDDTTENTYAFNIGKADWIASNADIASVIDKTAIRLSAEFATEYLFFKADRFPWNQAAFRNALLTAVPWEQLRAQALVPAETFIYPVSGYEMPAGLNDYFPDEAKLMLTRAKAEAGLQEADGVSVTLAVSDSPYMLSMAELLKTAWERIGVTVDVRKTPANRYLQSISGWNADLFVYTWIGDFADPLAFLELFRTGSTMGESAWSNAEYDTLLDSASKKTDYERFALLSRAEDVLLSDGVVIPISHPVALNVIDTAAIGGWYTNALDIHPLKYLFKQTTEPYVPNLVRADTLR